MVHICAWTSCFLKAAILHHFPSRVGLCLLRCVPLFIYGLFCRPLPGTTSLPKLWSVCSVTDPCSLRNFLKAAVLHYFPSRVWLDAAVLRCCLFPVHCSRFTKNIELGWSSCHTTSDKKDLFTSVTPLQASNSGGRGAILRLT